MRWKEIGSSDIYKIKEGKRGAGHPITYHGGAEGE
jgi:hypothetical protein